MRILAIEPFHGGSHAAFLEGLAAHSRHDFTLLTLPALKWKWRLRGSAMVLAERARQLSGPFDLLFASDFLNLAEFQALAPPPIGRLPAVVYFHENQFTYPVRDEKERDYQLAVTNLTTALAADVIWFNSAFHQDAFLDALDPFLRRLPPPRLERVADRLRPRSRVLHLGVDLQRIDRITIPPKTGPTRLVWNQRWEFDKNPEALFAALRDLAASGADFRLSVLGERFREVPPVFENARQDLAAFVDHWGYVPDDEAYLRVLGGSDVVLSTAIHEFFGISIVEAVYAGCYPLLPKRLTYPELIPPAFHQRHLYTTPHQLLKRLRWCCANPHRLRRGPAPGEPSLREFMAPFDWSVRAPAFDTAFDAAKSAARRANANA